MSGEPPIALTADVDSVLARAVGALGRFPADPPWVLVGGLAVFARLGSITRPTAIPIATVPALVALKTVSMVRRPHGNHPEKVGSDIHDLVRLVTAVGARTVAADLASDIELAGWVAGEVDRAFGRDLRYTLLRLRTNDRSAAARALTDADVAAVAVLADAIRDLSAR